jgi:hypothetical protein
LWEDVRKATCIDFHQWKNIRENHALNQYYSGLSTDLDIGNVGKLEEGPHGPNDKADTDSGRYGDAQEGADAVAVEGHGEGQAVVVGSLSTACSSVRSSVVGLNGLTI